MKWALKCESRAIRSAALFDGDAVEPPDTDPESEDAFRSRLGPTSRTILETCQREPVIENSGLVHHALRRRTIENYLPRSVLYQWAGKKQTRLRKVKALEEATFRDFYNMKGGHAKDRCRNPPPTWLPKHIDGPLEEGFGEDISQRFERVSADKLDEEAQRELQPFVNLLLERIR